jgi:hypothetical protein
MSSTSDYGKIFYIKETPHDCLFKIDPNEELPSPSMEVLNQILSKFSKVEKTTKYFFM